MTIRQINSSIIGGADKFLIYGDPGTGKTHLALTAPPPILYLCTGLQEELQTFYGKNFQEKYKMLHGRYLREDEVLFDAVDLAFSWKNEDATGFDQVKDMIQKAVNMEKAGEIKFNSIVIDNVTTLTELQIEKAIRLANLSRPPEATSKSTEQKYIESGVLQVADFEWKDVMNMMSKFLSEAFVLDDKVFVVIAHEWEQVVTDRATKVQSTTKVKPAFIGKQRDQIANLFSNVWRMYNIGQITAARTVGKDANPEIIAKSRIGGVISTDWHDPSLQLAIQKFRIHAENMSKTFLGGGKT
jgi:hypothetical protein